MLKYYYYYTIYPNTTIMTQYSKILLLSHNTSIITHYQGAMITTHSRQIGNQWDVQAPTGRMGEAGANRPQSVIGTRRV